VHRERFFCNITIQETRHPRLILYFKSGLVKSSASRSVVVGLVRWVLYLSCAIPRKEVAQYLPKLRHRRNAADDGEGPREFPLTSNSLESIYNRGTFWK
jgi:hypothetical protein